jgi:hypothetical protein
MTSRWNDTMLDQMRQMGDPLADNVIQALFERGGVYAVSNVMKTLVSNDYPTPEQLPDELRDYLDTTSRIAPADTAILEGGQRLFENYGPEMLLILATYSVPASYAAEKGVKVLYRTGYLNNRANHRLFETTQMVMDVMTPGGLESTGRGVRTAQKVRLMHAAIRQLMLTDPENPWDRNAMSASEAKCMTALGVPINQEDLAGTFLTFTYLIMDGLAKLGIHVAEAEQESYLDTWKVIGRLMGIQAAMIPATMVEAKTLRDTIFNRQIRVGPEGTLMTEALIKMLEGHMPIWPLTRWPAALIRFFLPPDVASGFGIPTRGPELQLLGRFVAGRRQRRPAAAGVRRRSWLFRKLSLMVVNAVVSAQLGGKRTAFILPTKLNQEWSRSRRMSVWQQLRRR